MRRLRGAPTCSTWRLHTALNPVTGAVEGALDPNVFWRAWAGGTDARVDAFAPGWDFWGATAVPLAEVRRSFGIPPEGLDLQDGQAAAPRA